MYRTTIILGSATTGAVAATVLPNTGGSLVIELACAVVAGLIAWGVFYTRSR